VNTIAAPRPLAVVIGATRRRGTGHAIAEELARHGYDIVATGRQRSTAAADGWRGLESVLEACRSQGVRADGVGLDVTSEADFEGLKAAVRTRGVTFDALVYNAAAQRGDDRVPVEELDLDTWEHVLNVNLTGAMLSCRHLTPLLRDGASIVLISSLAAQARPPRMAAYAASKAGLEALGGCLAAELADRDIRVNVVAPGLVDTERVRNLLESERGARRLRSIPLGRPVRSEEVAATVTFLLASSARSITGQTIAVNGGEMRR
jgi:3-oxoacyl-[acyl-carrier protein] reductase